MTNKEKADYFKQQASISLDEYRLNPTVTPRFENVVFAEKLFKINSVLNYITKSIENGTSQNEEEMSYLINSVNLYATDQIDIHWVQGNLITLNKGQE